MGLKEVIEEIGRRAKRSNVRLPEQLISTDELKERDEDGTLRRSLEYLIQHQKIPVYEKTSEGLRPIYDPDEALDRLEEKALYFHVERLIAAFNEKRIDHLNEVIEKLTPPYVFRQNGPTWEIVWEGRTISGLREKGFGHYHELFSNPDKEYTPQELLASETAPLPTEQKGLDIEHEYDYGERKDGELRVKKEEKIPISDVRTRRELKAERLKLEDALGRAESRGDPAGQLELKQEIKIISSTLREKHFKDASTKLKEMVAKRLDRALKEIKKYNEEAHEHFFLSVSPLKANHYQYKPINQIPWKLK